MHNGLVQIRNDLENVIEGLKTQIPDDEAFGPAQNDWSFPGLTQSELVEEAQAIIQFIDDFGGDELESHESRILDYSHRLGHIAEHTIPHIWSHSNDAVPAFMFTLQGLKKALESDLGKDLKAETSSKLNRLAKQVRAMEARAKDLEPRTETVSNMLDRIERAYNAADQLPTDLEALKEARIKITTLEEEATSDREEIAYLLNDAGELDEQLKISEKQAKKVLAQCETAYAAATSVGLAAAFAERSSNLSKSMWFWVIGLIIALGAGSYFGSLQLSTLSEAFTDPKIPVPMIVLNLAVSLLSIGAPVWFAWLATKQVGQRFKLSEDYAFKATVSRAYEGFRREVARYDKDMEAQLLASALSRFDELPLRLVEAESHGSPWHELASSKIVKQAIRTSPEFVNQVRKLANDTVSELTKKKESPPSPNQNQN